MLNELLLLDPTDLVGKLFCTFVSKSELDTTLAEIQKKYTIMYGKIFILEGSEEYICTYNIDPANLADNAMLPNTILCHRVKAHNVLYTLNALNTLIREANDGILDHSYMIDWQDYRNSILLTRNSELWRISTKVHNILHISEK